MERRVYSAKMRRLAAQAYKRHPMQLCLWVLEQIALRAVALSPLYIALRLGYSMTAALILCLALYLLMIYPMRFRAALTLTRMVRLTDASGLRPASYPARVGAGALRLLLRTPERWGRHYEKKYDRFTPKSPKNENEERK